MNCAEEPRDIETAGEIEQSGPPGHEDEIPVPDRLERRDDLSAADRDFIDQSVERARKAQVRARLVQALVYVLLVGIIVVLIGVIKQDYLRQQRDACNALVTTAACDLI